MKKKDLNKVLDLLLNGKAFCVCVEPYAKNQSLPRMKSDVHLTDEMKDILKKLKGKKMWINQS